MFAKVSWNTSNKLPMFLRFSERIFLRIHWRLLTILRTSKKVYEVMFFNIKVCKFWKCVQYTLHLDKTRMLKKIPFGQNKRYKKCTLFLSRGPTHRIFTFNLWFLYELKHKIRLSKTVSGSFHFDSISVKFLFLFKMHGLFEFKTS